MRRMTAASSIAEAKQLQQEQLVQQLSTWSMMDTLATGPFLTWQMACSAFSLPTGMQPSSAMHEFLCCTFLNALQGQKAGMPCL